MLLRLCCLLAILGAVLVTWGLSAGHLYATTAFAYNRSEPVTLQLHHCDLTFADGAADEVVVRKLIYESGGDLRAPERVEHAAAVPHAGANASSEQARTLYGPTFSRTVWKMYGGAKGLGMWY